MNAAGTVGWRPGPRPEIVIGSLFHWGDERVQRECSVFGMVQYLTYSCINIKRRVKPASDHGLQTTCLFMHQCPRTVSRSIRQMHKQTPFTALILPWPLFSFLFLIHSFLKYVELVRLENGGNIKMHLRHKVNGTAASAGPFCKDCRELDKVVDAD